ncbi:PQQ-dependent sugar dehydrogenase [Aquipuribacter sp. SD81]|uniref:PQQ-dependent sugar dehydrogenase n=1 Tax=Aquipuribacter sp. SD81 TaxID=3127703 RepID=UPI00301A9052
MGRNRAGTSGRTVGGALAAGLALALTGCAEGEVAAPGTAGPPASASPAPSSVVPSGPATDVAPASPEPSATATASPEAAPEPSSTFSDVAAAGTPDPAAAEDVVTGLDVPWDLAFLPDGSALVTLRDEARVVHVDPDGTLSEVTADGDDGTVAGVAPDGEGGLLGVTTDATAEHVFVYLTGPDDNRVVRYAFDRERLALTEPEPVVTGIPKAEVHNGGRIDLGPDGFLYVATGDARDTSASPDTGSLAGKVLRVTTDGEPAPGNPVAGSPVWTSGHRNVQGLGWSPDGTMWASEFGQNTTDELNVLRAGADYGWPEVEGVGDVDGLTDPVATWDTDEASPSGIAVTADAVYLAALQGERVWRVPVEDGAVSGEPETVLDGYGRVRHVEVGPDGALWLLTSNTFRGDPRDGDDRIVRVPLS